VLFPAILGGDRLAGMASPPTERSTRRRPVAVMLLRVAAVGALLAAVVVFAVPVGLVSDTQCGSVPQAAFNHFRVCSDAGRPRLYTSLAFACTAVVLGVVSLFVRPRVRN
jgi:hypothetical protein